MEENNWTDVLAELIGFIIVWAVFGFAVMSLWNSLIPNIFNGVSTINYWQGVGIFVLCKILFSSIGLLKRDK